MDAVSPHIGARLADRLAELARQETSVVVLDAAVMEKAGWDRLCDRLVYVDTPREQRWERAVAEVDAGERPV